MPGRLARTGCGSEEANSRASVPEGVLAGGCGVAGKTDGEGGDNDTDREMLAGSVIDRGRGRDVFRESCNPTNQVVSDDLMRERGVRKSKKEAPPPAVPPTSGHE